MSSASVLDLEATLAPLSESAPSGPNLRVDYSPGNKYRQMKDLRLAARRLERPTHETGDQPAVREKPNWRAVSELGKEILQKYSKDLEVAAWLVEALVREHGFAGLRDGFKLCKELVMRYWDNIHPEADPNDPDEPNEPPRKVAAIAGLAGDESDGTLIHPIYCIALVHSPEKGPLGVSAYQQASALDAIENAIEKQKRIDHGAVSMEAIQRACSDTPVDRFKSLDEDLAEARSEFEALYELLDAKCGSERAPSGLNIRRALENCSQTLRSLCPALSPDPHVDLNVDVGPGSAQAKQPGRVCGPVSSREEAFEQLRQIARFFRDTEPHSVLSWQLEECVRWGKMTLPDLLTDLISDSSTREAFFRRVGIPTSSL